MRTCSSTLQAVAARMREDIATVQAKDPAAESAYEVLLYPHILALWTYRVAHRLWRRGHRLTARALSLGARVVSGIEIHPAAVIGRRFFIDHGTAVVIGATVRIGNDVMLYHQVTLGSVGWWKDLRRPAGARRHPVVEDGVIIGTGASVLGPVTVGAGARIAAHAVVMTDLEPGARVTTPMSAGSPAPGPVGDQVPADTAQTGSVADAPDGPVADVPGGGSVGDAPARSPAVSAYGANGSGPNKPGSAASGANGSGPAANGSGPAASGPGKPGAAVSGPYEATPAPEGEPAAPPASGTAPQQPAPGERDRSDPVAPAAVRPAALLHAATPQNGRRPARRSGTR